MLQHSLHCLPLLLSQSYSCRTLPFSHQLPPSPGGNRHSLPLNLQKSLRRFSLSPVKIIWINQHILSHRLLSQKPLCQILLHNLPDNIPGNPNALFHIANQLAIRNTAMAIKSNFLQLKIQSRRHSKPATGIHAHGNIICHQKANAIYLSYQTVRILLHNLHRKRAVFLINTACVDARYLMLLQPQHYLPQLSLFLIGSMDFFCCFGPNASHFPQAMGLFFNNLQGLPAKDSHNSSRHSLAYPFDYPRGQKPFNALGTGGSANHHMESLKLTAKAGMLYPLSL